MRFWFSCFPLDPEVTDRLAQLGLETAEGQRLNPESLLLLYDAPHSLLARLAADGGVTALQRSYRQLSEQVRAGATALAIHRAMAIPAEALADWLRGGRPPASALALPDPAPVTAVIAAAVLDQEPALLEAYLDLELQAELLGGPVDARYLDRLRRVIAAVPADLLLQRWQEPWQHAQGLGRQLEASEAHLAQLQDERRAREQLEHDCAELRSRLDAQAALEPQLREVEQQLREAHGDLERSFLACERLRDLGRQCRIELARAERVLSQSR